MDFLTSVFAVDCLTYTVLSNHLNVVLRSQSNVAKEWSDDDVARRWLRLFPKRRDVKGDWAEANDPEMQMITSDAKRLAEVRHRL